MKLMNVDYILKALETFKQGNDMATLNVHGSKANDQTRGRLEAGVQRGEAAAVMQGRDDEGWNKSGGTGHGELVKLQDVCKAELQQLPDCCRGEGKGEKNLKGVYFPVHVTGERGNSRSTGRDI